LPVLPPQSMLRDLACEFYWSKPNRFLEKRSAAGASIAEPKTLSPDWV
jgi:hypothetical protein